MTGFCSGFALGRVLLLALRWFVSVRVCSGLRSRFPQSASVLSPLVMWLNNAIYAIWLLSGNVMTDQGLELGCQVLVQRRFVLLARLLVLLVLQDAALRGSFQR